jgi:hypothetical protein
MAARDDPSPTVTELLILMANLDLLLERSQADESVPDLAPSCGDDERAPEGMKSCARLMGTVSGAAPPNPR